MFDARVEKLKKKMRKKPISNKLHIEHRHPALLDIEGWYQCDVDLINLPSQYQQLVRDYGRSETKLKFTRWLSKKGLLNNDEISRIGKLLKSGVSFKISCRHNDLLRLSESTHYFSCFGSWRGIQQLRYLADPDLAIVYVPDKSGKYLWRSLIRLMLDPEDSSKFVFSMYRPYGNSNVHAICERLNKIFPLYRQTNRYRLNKIVLSSASTHENEIVGKHVWSDHFCQLNPITKRLEMVCLPYDVAGGFDD